VSIGAGADQARRQFRRKASGRVDRSGSIRARAYPSGIVMKNLLIRQSLFVPLAAMLVPTLLALGVPHYSSMSQHVSELQLLDNPVASVMRVAPVICGVSILLFGIGAYLAAPARSTFTALTSAAVAANFISAGLFVSGGPLHGLYGIGFFIPLVPACFAAESGLGRKVRQLSLGVAVVSMAYLWLNLSGLDPFRGMTQRMAIVVILGWYSFASHQLLWAMGASASAVLEEAPRAGPRGSSAPRLVQAEPAWPRR
jgi:hypothetical protein